MSNNPHLQVLIQLAKIDGETSEAELLLIREISASKFVSDVDLDNIMKESEDDSSVPALENLSDDEKIELLTNLVMVMRADGRIELREMSFCFDIVKRVGFSETLFFNLVVGVFDKGKDMAKESIRNYVESGLKLV